MWANRTALLSAKAGIKAEQIIADASPTVKNVLQTLSTPILLNFIPENERKVLGEAVAKDAQGKMQSVINTQQQFQDWVKKQHPVIKTYLSPISGAYDLISSIGAILPLQFVSSQMESTAGKPEAMAKMAAESAIGFITFPATYPSKIAADPLFGIGYTTGQVATMFIGPKGLKRIAYH
jgi:hypothetical protein